MVIKKIKDSSGFEGGTVCKIKNKTRHQKVWFSFLGKIEEKSILFVTFSRFFAMLFPFFFSVVFIFFLIFSYNYVQLHIKSIILFFSIVI